MLASAPLDFKMQLFRKIFLGIVFVLFSPSLVFSGVSISEIMYDFPGTEGQGEHDWIEVVNNGGADVDLSKFKFFEANTNHGLKFDRGAAILPPGGFAVIANATSTFISDWPNFSGTLFDSSFSLNSTSAGETLEIRDPDLVLEDTVTYSSDWGAKDDGNSLQKIDGVWKALLPTPGKANTADVGSTTPTDQTATSTPSETSSGSSQSQGSDSHGKSSWPLEPQIISRIIGPSTAIAGADVIFKGEAVGLDKKPLQNPRFAWNFGDGATKEGESVLHAYNFPGEYIVILEVSSGISEGSSRLVLNVIPADISIEGVVFGSSGKVELVNNSGRELDLSWWRIQSGANFFTLPKNTKILPNGRMPLSAGVLKFPVEEQNLALLYPNGVLAKKFVKSTPAPVAGAGVDPVAVIPTATENTLSKIAVEKPEPIAVVSKLSTDGGNVARLQTAAVLEAVDGEDVLEEKPTESRDSNLSLWLYGVGGIVILAIGFILAPKPQAPPKSAAEEYKIVED